MERMFSHMTYTETGRCCFQLAGEILVSIDLSIGVSLVEYVKRREAMFSSLHEV